MKRGILIVAIHPTPIQVLYRVGVLSVLEPGLELVAGIDLPREVSRCNDLAFRTPPFPIVRCPQAVPGYIIAGRDVLDSGIGD